MKVVARATWVIKCAAGGVASLAVVGLGLVFWPSLKPGRISAKSAVEQPVFVVASVSKPAPPPAAVTAVPVAAPAPEKAGLDQLAAALKKGGTPPAAPTPVAVKPEAQDCFAHGLVALAKGDLAAARRWLENAAERGETRAYMALGDAYNPSMLARLGVIGAPGDAALARSYYNRAASAGLTGARDRLASLEPLAR